MHFSFAEIKHSQSLKHININRPTKKLIVYIRRPRLLVQYIFSDHRYLFTNTYLLIYSNVLPLCSSNNTRLGRYTSHINFLEYPHRTTLYTNHSKPTANFFFCHCFSILYTIIAYRPSVYIQYGWFAALIH